MTEFNWHVEAGKKWDNRAEYWSENSEHMWEKGSRKTIIPFIANYIPKGSKFADIGCGDGYGSYRLVKEGYNVIGIDISDEMIETAIRKWGQYSDQLSFIKADLTSLPFEDDHFSAVMAINSIEWTEIPFVALNELSRVIEKDGYLCAGILGPTAQPRINSYKRLYGEKVIMNTMMPWEFEKLATEAGWEIVDSHGVNKREVIDDHLQGLPQELKQALSFMWIFMLKNKK